MIAVGTIDLFLLSTSVLCHLSIVAPLTSINILDLLVFTRISKKAYYIWTR
jgi:hypothetical protein